MSVYTGQWSPETAHERAELRSLERRYSGTLQQFRLTNLGRRLLARRSIAVRHNTCGFSGDRWRLELDDGSVLRLKLYWPVRRAVAALLDLTWVEGEGWRAVVRSTDGDRVLVRAFAATLTP
jgi:hypothetical protein